MKNKELAFKAIEDVLKRIKSLKDELGAVFVAVAYREDGKIITTSEGAPLFVAKSDSLNYAVSKIASSLSAAETAQLNLEEYHPQGIIIEGTETDIIAREINSSTMLIFQISVKKIWTKIIVARAIKDIKGILGSGE